jgi:PAS domain S-box-containing protein
VSSPSPVRASGSVIGTLDHTLRVAHISRNVEQALGYRAGDVLGMPAASLVHPSDTPAFHDVMGRASSADTGVEGALRVRTCEGTWAPMGVTVACLAAELPRFGFALSPTPPGPAEAARRLADLEGRLQRIAEELEAAGVYAGQGVTDPPLVHRLELPEKQREVLERLLRGERVPGIAERMYLSQSTVRNHLCAIFRRVGVHSQEELLQALRRDAQPR